MRSYFVKLANVLMLFVLLIGCSNNLNTMVNEQGNEEQQIQKVLEGIYSYEYNSIEPEHQEIINKWLIEAKTNTDQTKMHFYSIANDVDKKDNKKYGYIYAKGYKDFEVTFVYSVDDPKEKGQLHIVGNKGSNDDEVFIKVKYDTRFILGVINSDQSIFNLRK